jgi:GxxExxY protein
MQDRNNEDGMEGLNTLVSTIIAECKNVQAATGKGLYPSVYQQMLYQRLMKKGLFVQRQVPVFADEEQHLEVGLKAEFIVENSVICEIKSVDALLPMHQKALAAFLRLTNKPVGLLVNFKAPQLKDGIVKLVNTGYKKIF